MAAIQPVTKDGLQNTLNSLAASGKLKDFYDLYQGTTTEEFRQMIETALIKEIEVYGRNGWIDDIAGLLGRDGLSDAVKIAIEPALIGGIEVCGWNGWIDSVAKLLGRTDLSDAVKSAARLVLDKKK